MQFVRGPEMGRDFVVIWVCMLDEDPADCEAIPWPASAVHAKLP